MAVKNLQKAIDESFGEVIFSTNEMVIAQCYKEDISGKALKNSATQGSIVKVISSYDTSHAAFGLVAKINNSSLDNIHKPSALGLSFKELAELQPQVYDLLRKELEIYLFAHQDQDNQIVNYPPAKPMMIHDFVYTAQDKEILELTNDFSSLINLIKRNQLKLDLLINLIMQGYKLRNNNESYLINIGKALSLAFSDEVESLIVVLKRLSQNKEKSNK